MPVSLDTYDRIPELLRELNPTGVTVLADPAVADHTVTRKILAEIAHAGFTPDRVVTPADGGMPAVEAAASRLCPGELVVGVGGGSTLDFAKLVAAVGRHPDLLRYLTSGQRSGLVALPLPWGEHAEVLAVPTTLGTGSEAGPVACFPHGDGKRIAMGECLRPRAALRVPEATETLPGRLVMDGVLEALFRTVIPYSSDTLDLPEQDAAVEDLAGRLLVVGDRLARHTATGLPAPAPERLLAARLSAESQRGAINIGRNPYAVKCWAVANELSTTLGLAKMRAVSALWPVVWRQALRGDTRFGSADRVHRLWERLRQRAPWLAPGPDDGLERLMLRWRIDRTVHLAPHLRHHIALRSVRAWGAGLPTLAGLSADDVAALLAEATEPTASAAGSPEPLPAA
ncbi:daptide-type RiPP biosynthesis dehydogenase [Streptomyces tibetensis]|uniref:daptide-type RiPP biosynthesis dehydogenase n=1 Tax=Streptomyces tibetensis TaxID=2382123 RepID=UPI00382E2AED